MFVVSLVRNIPFNSETFVVTLSISRSYRSSFQRYSRGKFYIRVFTGMSVLALGVSMMYYVIRKKNIPRVATDTGWTITIRARQNRKDKFYSDEVQLVKSGTPISPEGSIVRF